VPEDAGSAATQEAPESQEGTEERNPFQNQPEQPDISAQLSKMGEQLDRMAPKQEEPTEESGDLFEALGMGQEDAEEQYSPEQLAQLQALQNFNPDAALGEQQDEAEQLAALFSQEAERIAGEKINEYVSQQETEKRVSDLEALRKRIPDIEKPENLAYIAQELDALGVDDEVPSPHLVEQLFYAKQARARAESEKQAAEQAAQEGAVLETGAAPRQQGDDSERDTRRRIFKAEGGGNTPY
jgi:hypothetical protein